MPFNNLLMKKILVRKLTFSYELICRVGREPQCWQRGSGYESDAHPRACGQR